MRNVLDTLNVFQRWRKGMRNSWIFHCWFFRVGMLPFRITSLFVHKVWLKLFKVSFRIGEPVHHISHLHFWNWWLEITRSLDFTLQVWINDSIKIRTSLEKVQLSGMFLLLPKQNALWCKAWHACLSHRVLLRTWTTACEVLEPTLDTPQLCDDFIERTCNPCGDPKQVDAYLVCKDIASTFKRCLSTCCFLESQGLCCNLT